MFNLISSSIIVYAFIQNFMSRRDKTLTPSRSMHQKSDLDFKENCPYIQAVSLEPMQGRILGRGKGENFARGGVPPPKIFREGQEPPGIFPGRGRLYLPPPEYRCVFKIKESIRYISIFS